MGLRGDKTISTHSYCLTIIKLLNLQHCTSTVSVLSQDVVTLMLQYPSAPYALLSQVIIIALESLELLTVGADVWNYIDS